MVSIIGSGPQMKAVSTLATSIQVLKSWAHFAASTRPVNRSMSCIRCTGSQPFDWA